jgi:nucleoid-associated protein YgaU
MTDKRPLLVLAALVLVGLGGLAYTQRNKAGLPVAVTPQASKSTEVAAAKKDAPPAAEAAKPAKAPAGEQKVAAAEPPKTVEPAETGVQKQADVPLPSFDTVRVEQGGSALVAGRAEPGSEIAIKLNGAVVGMGKANEDGAFVVAPDKPLPEGPGVISIEMKDKAGKVIASQQTVAVAVKPKSGSTPMVAVLTPGAPTKIVQDPAQPKQALEPMKTVTIDSVDYDDKGNMIFGGRGPAGSKVQLYVDNKAHGDLTEINPKGEWTMASQVPIAVGTHALRADEIGADGGVKSRVEMPSPFFREDPARVIAQKAPAAEPPKTTTTTTTVVAKDQETGVEVKAQAQVQVPVKDEPKPAEVAAAAPATPAEPAKPEQPASEPAKPAEAPAQAAAAEPQAAEPPKTEEPKPVTPQEQSATVAAADPEPAAQPVPNPTITIQPGNNLWRLSRDIYGRGVMYTVIYEANKDNIRNPNLIYPGQIFVTPRGEAKAAN